jgi:demethylmenaquinone methyltransferase/2-methoxy-6-polyprenyl-1,4-benzoquinol methylase
MPIDPQQTNIHNVFTRVARYYDFMNDALSLGWHRCWKKTFIKKLDLKQDQWIADIGCGSGDLGKYIQKIYPYFDAKIIGVDPNPSMIEKANPLFYRARIVADAKFLPFDDSSLDGCLMGFSLRNITYPIEAVKEAFRVLKPGGFLGVLDFFPQDSDGSCVGYAFHQTKKIILPMMGKIFAKDKESYDYLAKSIDDFMDPKTLVHEMGAVGFQSTQIFYLSGGICTMILAQKPQ